MHTNELKGLLEVLTQVLLVAVGGRQTLVVEEAEVVMVEREVRGDVKHVADVEPLHLVEVLGVMLVAQVEEGQNGCELGILNIGGRRQRVR